MHIDEGQMSNAVNQLGGKCPNMPFLGRGQMSWGGTCPTLWRQRPDITTAVDWDVKHLFKQTNKVIFNEQAQYVINIFVYPWFCYRTM